MRLVAALLLATGTLAVLTISFGMRGSGSYPLLYAQILLAVITLLLLPIVAQEWQKVRHGDDPRDASDPISWQAITGLVSVCIYAISWEIVGHAPATAVFLLIMLLIAGVRAPFPILAFIVVMPVGLFFLFIKLLKIPLPRPW